MRATTRRRRRTRATTRRRRRTPATCRLAGTAANAEQLDGLDSTAFLRSDAKAADSDTLDGIDSTQFIQGNGQTVAGGRAFAPLAFDNVFRIEGLFAMAYFCPSILANNGQFFFTNLSGSAANVFVESGDANPTFSVVANQSSLSLGTAASGDSFHIQAQGTFGVATIEAASVHRATDCHAQAQAVLTR